MSNIEKNKFKTNMHCSRNALYLSVASVSLLVNVAPAVAQEPSESAVNEIIVTAQKRAQSLIDVPAAVSAFSGDTLSKLGVQSVPEITTRVPNFRVTYERGPNSIPNFTLRGIRGAALASRLNESAIAVYADEVFMGDETALNAGLFDIQRVEVLRGPQGTVFGKNTTGGLVHFISAKPTDTFSGHASAQYGTADQTILDAAVSGPLSDAVRVRLAGNWNRSDGMWENRYLGAGANGVPKKVGFKDVWGLRGTIDADLTERTLLRVIANYSQDNSEPTPNIYYGALLQSVTKTSGLTRADLCSYNALVTGQCTSVLQNAVPAALDIVGRKIGSGITNLTPSEQYIRGRGRSVTANLSHEMDWATFTSITNYMKNSYVMAFDADAGATPSTVTGGAAFDFLASYSNKAKQFSQEVRLNGQTDSIDWVTGLFYYSDDKSSRQLTNLRSAGVSLLNTGALKTKSYAGFAQLDAHISSTVTMSLGGRYTIESRRLTDGTTSGVLNSTGGAFVPFQDVLAGMKAAGRPTKVENKNFTGKFSVSYRPNDDSNYYVTYSRGIRGAGFNTGFSPTSSLASNIAQAGPVNEETLDAFEIGMKNRFLDRKLSINTALFYYDFKNFEDQIFTFSSATNTVQQNYLNIGDARIYGVETEILYSPSDRFDFNFSGGWLHGEITKSSVILTDTFNQQVPAKGLPISQIPKWTFSSYIAYHLPVDGVGRFTIQPEVTGTGAVNYSLHNEPLAHDKAHVFVNGRLIWNMERSNITLEAFVTNLFNEKSFLNVRDSVGSLGRQNVAEGLGRLWGVKAGVTF